ncbi:hypothetical protein QNM97_21700 [Gordonia sp. L191]|uniref:hypothetical protein n=1 Tax=Gordonia sp. L191 TaxID=2982699 RepID=UPI0024BF17DE|nr:hypothetical protein [Gordonia sp. L191]WHU46565.1 hypothetical protein QNM97_21700 [Gordonia sp. L191]
MKAAILNGIDATPEEYFKLKTGVDRSKGIRNILAPFKEFAAGAAVQADISTFIECMKLSVMFVADFEYHARTGFEKDDVLAFIVSMETEGQPPERYPADLK